MYPALNWRQAGVSAAGRMQKWLCLLPLGHRQHQTRLQYKLILGCSNLSSWSRPRRTFICWGGARRWKLVSGSLHGGSREVQDLFQLFNVTKDSCMSGQLCASITSQLCSSLALLQLSWIETEQGLARAWLCMLCQPNPVTLGFADCHWL